MSDVSSTAPTWNKQVVRAVILATVLAGCTWFSSSSSSSSPNIGSPNSHSLMLLHLLAFSSWFGCSVWVSFPAGIVMFKTLPRHTFGRLQSKLFPAYFLFSAGAIIIAIGTSGDLLSSTTSTTTTASAITTIIPYSLIVILACILINLLYFEPATTRVMYQRHAVEKRLGTGRNWSAPSN